MDKKYLKSVSHGIYSTDGVIITNDQYENLKAGKIDWESDKKKIMKRVTIPVDLFYRLMRLDIEMNKCSWADDITIKPDGEHELDPCVYTVKEVHKNVTVTVSECEQCGSVNVSWERQSDTEDEYFEE